MVWARRNDSRGGSNLYPGMPGHGIALMKNVENNMRWGKVLFGVGPNS
jgi:hypothetical protein